MRPDFYLRSAVRPALSLLPAEMSSREAEAMLVAIALQESGLRQRYQLPIRPGEKAGPARGYAQFESGGVRAILGNPSTRPHAFAVLEALDYPPGNGVAPYVVQQTMQHNDVLTAAFTRLLLWPVAGPLPTRDEERRAYDYYLEAFRPGKPGPARWPAAWEIAWTTVNEGEG